MKRALTLTAFILLAVPAFAQQSGYGGDGKASSSASVSSFLKLYETPPTAPTLAAGAGGTTTTGNHNVKITCYNGTGETSGGTASSTVDTATAQFSISAIPTCSVLATGRKVYMNTVAAPTSYYLVATIANNTGTTSTITSNDATIAGGAAIPTSNTMLDTRLTIGQSALYLPIGVSFYPGGTSGLSRIYAADNASLNITSYNTITFTTNGSNQNFLFTTSDGAGDMLKINSGGYASVGYLAGTSGVFNVYNSDTGAMYTDGRPVLVVGTRRSGQTGDLARFLNSGATVLSGYSSTGMPYIGSGTPASIIGTTASHGQNITYLIGEELLTIAAAATTDTAMTIPASAVVLSVSVRVTTVIPTAATFTVTGATSGTVFNTAAVAVAATTTDSGTKSCPYFNVAAQKIRITPDVQPAAATGVVRVTVVYYVVTPPTS